MNSLLRSSRSSIRRFLPPLAALLGFVQPLLAATYTWDGSASGLWSNSANWSGVLVPPLTDDEVVFPVGGRLAMNNDLGAGIGIHLVTFSGAGYSLTGSGISLSSTLGVPRLRATHTTGSTAIGVPVTLAEAATFSSTTGGTLVLNPGANVITGGNTLTLDADGTIAFLSSITGAGGVTLTGTGSVVYAAAQPYSGPTALNSGSLTIASGFAVSSSTITVAAGATLSGVGTAAGVTSMGTVSPAGTGIGRLTTTGALTFSNVATSILALDLGASTSSPGNDGAGTTYDQLTTSGNVNINAASVLQLTPTGTFAPAAGETYTLLDKTNSGVITGTFSGIPNNGTVDVGNRRLRINYASGTGSNDIVATVINVPPTISDIADLGINEDATTPALAFTVGDLETSVASLTVTPESNNTTLVPTGNISVLGTGANRTVTVTPAANQFGSATITLTVSDGAATASDTFLLTVAPANDAPSAAGLSLPETYTEDTALNLSNITVSDPDDNITVTLTLSTGAAGTLSTNGSASGSATFNYNAGTRAGTVTGSVSGVNFLLGALTFHPALNFNSNFTIATRVSDGVAPALTGSKSMTGIPVNDAPSASNLSAAESYTEDSTRDLINIVIADLDSNVTATLTLSPPAAGSLTTGTFGSVTSTFEAGTGVWSASGPVTDVNSQLAAVSFVPALNFNSDFSIHTEVSDGAAAPLTGSKPLTGTAVNDAPILDVIPNPPPIPENSGQQSVNLTGIGSGAANELQVLTVTATSNNPGLIPDPSVTYTSPDPTALLNYTPVANTFGSAVITVTVNDGQALNNTFSRDFTVVVIDINSAPSFTPGPNVNAPSNAGAVTFPNWATGISAGSPEESGQALTFIVVSNSNPALFQVPPGVSPAGTLVFTAAPGAEGTAVIGLRLQDSGGTVDGGVDTSAVVFFPITLASLPTPPLPSFDAGGTGSGTASIEWNFDAAGTDGNFWMDNLTVPGWFAQINNGSTASGFFQPSDGTTALTGLINCGSDVSPDRALGSKCTTTGGFANIAYAVVVRNAGILPVRLSRLRYAEELWRSGSTPDAPEKVTVFYAVSDTPPASIASGGSSTTAAAGAGFAALPAAASTQKSNPAANSALDGNLAANRSPVDFSPAAGDLIAIPPGHYLTLKWTDTNESQPDGHQAIDDVRLDLVEIPCAVAATAALVRRPSVLAADGSADIMEVTFTANGFGSVSLDGWRIAGGRFDGTTGSYGTPRTLNFPVTDFSSGVPLTIRDAADPGCFTTLTLSPAPTLLLGLNGLAGNNSYLQATGAPAIFQQTSIQSDPASSLVNEITTNPGSGVLLTDPVTLTPGTEKCVTLTVEVEDTSNGTGLESNDALRVEMLTFGPANEVEVLTHDFDLNGDGRVNGGNTPLEDEFNTRQQPAAAKWTSSFRLAGTIPAEATSFQLRITGATDSSNEILRFRDLILLPCLDTDGDGVSDAREWAHGTNPASAVSVFDISSFSSTAAETSVTLPTVPGFDYQPLSSSSLTSWTREALPTAGDGTPKILTGPNTGPRTFRRYLVLPEQTVQP